MKFGVNTLLWTAGFDRSHLELLPRLKEQGFDGVEIATFRFDGFPAQDIRRALDDCGLERTFCSALTGELSLVSDDAKIRQRALDFVRQGIETAAELGASVMVGPYCAPVGQLLGRRRTADEWSRAVEGLRSLGETLDACRVTLAVEPLNRFETYFLNTAADAVALCEEVGHPRVGVLFDTFHANIEEKDIAAACRSLGRHLKHVHACENDRGIPGSGHVEWPAVFAALGALGYDGWLVIESFGFGIPEIAAAACIWRDLAPSPEAIAFDGLRFLRQQASLGAQASA
ncbi:MAG: sugar phosphate isomerase/epimerase family protein [Bryobacterales bacterium]|nr:sugar phosphate isomerase/epimerase [Bryobacteraceae bacterium]MDW8354598.1 sugar phosphate isomerase/epimerase family protein [Bryobacterales bacterium]